MIEKKMNEKINEIEKLAAEFAIYLDKSLLVPKFKIRIYSNNKNDIFLGCTNIQIKRSHNRNMVEGAVGYGDTIEEALEDTLENFLSLLDYDYPKKDYPDGLDEDDIEYLEHYEL